jgi:hypothetical protein
MIEFKSYICLKSGQVFVIIIIIFFFYKYIKNYYNENLKEQKQEGLGNPNLNLRMKVRGDNASEDAGPLARGTDASKPGSPIKVISQVYWVARTQTQKHG